MTPAETRRLRELFEACLEHPPDEQRDAAHAMCADSPGLLQALLDLLDRDHDLGQAEQEDDGGVRLARLSQIALADRSLRGQRIGPFEVGECIGVGGMGSVHRMHRVDGQVRQTVALKVLRPDSVNPALLGRFSNERRVLASLTHPGISRFLDAGALADGRPYVVMELIQGTPILEWCDHQRLNLRQRLKLFLDVLAAVEHAHRMLIVHRDIKSSNVLVTGEGRVKLLDFGIAKMLRGPADDATGTAERFLTPWSTAPEHYLGEPVGVGCDIYALGQLLYELLCGRPPFDFREMSAAEFERTLLQRPAPSMTQRCLDLDSAALSARGFGNVGEIRRRLRGDLDLVVLKCLRKRPEERHASVEQLDAELRRVLERRPIRARQGERWYRLRKFLSRNQVPAALVATLALVVASSALFATWQAVEMARERERAVLERDRAQYAVNLLRDAFVAADPARLLGGEVTAREILGSARQPLEALRTEQPELFASQALILADVELSLLMSESAADILEQGIEAATTSSAGPELRRALWMKLAEALVDSSRHERLEQALNQVHMLDRQARPDRLRVEGRRALFRQQPGDAVEKLEQALALIGAAPEPSEHLELRIRNDLATAYSNSGAQKRALDMYGDTLHWLEQRYPPGHPLEVLTRLRRIDALRRAGELEQAEAEVRDVQGRVIESYGSRSAMAGRWYVTRATLATALGRPDEAIAHYRDAIEAWRDTLGPDHPNHLRLAINLAALLSATDGDGAEAKQMFEQALALSERQYGPGSRVGAMIRAHYAELVRGQRDAGEALRILLGDSALTPERALEVPPWRRVFADISTDQRCAASGLSPSIRSACVKMRDALAAASADPAIE